jgi:hypothetical protein
MGRKLDLYKELIRDSRPNRSGQQFIHHDGRA